MTEHTFVIIKPDAVEAGHVGAILGRYEAAGLRVEAMDLRRIDAGFADRHYAEHLERDFYPPLREFMTSGPLVAVILSGADAISTVRGINGATDPTQAEPGTIRADFAENTRRNAVHASDSRESAEREISLWFPKG
ncbi:nucleoside-diphosphate kinase [Tessaracoccus flavus]|uniref:Nucleoside diphosphate kinase n=1 Tax=Tessaracoccus flavus TaxID=1610493 RepID=A0A1Q2CFM9_9ACTN|nr:nucleoside-diphosphate kinase [Tessaracoccus flavus]AQP44870.1 nucleoside-diphosphate kinase [Tessaracoccus flavus]SDY97579.1 nucleoside diphosphate kinase [Tessaracoccus flavus]